MGSRTKLEGVSSGCTVLDSGEMGGERGAMYLPVDFELTPFMVNSTDGTEALRGKLSCGVCSGGESMAVLGSRGPLFSILTS